MTAATADSQLFLGKENLTLPANNPKTHICKTRFTKGQPPKQTNQK